MCQEWKIEKSVNIFDVFDIPLKATVYVAWFRPVSRCSLEPTVADFCLQKESISRDTLNWRYEFLRIRVVRFVKLFAFPFRSDLAVAAWKRRPRNLQENCSPGNFAYFIASKRHGKTLKNHSLETSSSRWFATRGIIRKYSAWNTGEWFLKRNQSRTESERVCFSDWANCMEINF